MSIESRLKKVEGRRGSEAGGVDQQSSPHLWERYFHAPENARRELEGREFLPDLPYTEEDRDDDRRCLEEVIPSYRAASPGWQSGEGKAFLDQWEQHIKEKLKRP